MLHTENHSGFTLVEMLVSAAIMSVMILAVISVVYKSRDVQISDMHRREVRAIIDARFERAYQYNQFKSLQPGEISSIVTIDSRSGNLLTGTMLERIDSTSIDVSGSQIPVKRVLISIAWDETKEKRDSISFSKWIAEAQ